MQPSWSDAARLGEHIFRCECLDFATFICGDAPLDLHVPSCFNFRQGGLVQSLQQQFYEARALL